MKAAPFDYANPTTVAEAISLKQQYGDSARFLAGGQSLLPTMNMRLSQPDLLIDINGIKELDGIREISDTIHIGALTRTETIGTSTVVARCLPLFARCVEHIAHPAIRTIGTFGGSVALADPAAEWPAACLALDAKVIVIGPTGEREIDSRNFFEGFYSTAMAEDELLVRVEIPVQPKDVRAVALEQVRRRGDFATVGVLAQAIPDSDGRLRKPRVVFFGIADRPVRVATVERHIEAGTRQGIEEAISALAEECTFIGDLYHAPATKKHLAGVLLNRAIEQLLII